jgi:uncharacterized protein YfaS (alpha-2-macroglobulin family)
MVANRRVLAALAALLLVLAAQPVRAARPLLDSGKWDRYFALFARDSSVPWKPNTVRLDTFSGAAVDFAVYDVDPADVLVAGANARPRAVDTAKLQPVAKWRFTPRAGLGFTSSDIALPLQNKEGFFVVEARRADAVQQVWVNSSRIGMIVKETPAGALVYGADLGTGRALGGMRITYLVEREFQYDKTDQSGISHVPARARFALAEWGRSKAFVSFLPQSPPPATVVGVRADRATVRAGETVHVVGFARKRNGEEYRPASGQVVVTLTTGGRTLASQQAQLDRAGAFSGELVVPADAASGDVAVLANTGGASGGATIHVDAVGDVALAIAAPCTAQCPPDAPIEVTVSGKRGGAPAAGQSVRLRIVRSPHVVPPGTPAGTPEWGTTAIVDGAFTLDANGTAKVKIPAPGDGLASTYGVEAQAGSATASAQLISPLAKVALAVVPLRDRVDAGAPVTLEVRGFDAIDGLPVGDLDVHVSLAHGATTQEQNVKLDSLGNGSVTFRDAALGLNVASADTMVDGKRVLDASAVTVTPGTTLGGTATRSSDVRITLDRTHQRPGEKVTVNAQLGGAVGDALVTMECARGVTTAVVGTKDGVASTSLTVPETVGAVAVGVAFVRDGMLVAASAPVVVDGPGHERTLALQADKPIYGAGATAKITIADVDRGGATLAVRLTDRRAAGGAAFDDMAGVLGSNGTTTQVYASQDPAWHAWVTPARSTAGDIYGVDRPQAAPPRQPPMAAETDRVIVWKVDRLDGTAFSFTVPNTPGRYVLSIVKMTDDGDVGTGSLPVTVQ